LSLKQHVANRTSLTRNVEVVGSSPIKGPRCFFEQELYPFYLVLIGSSNGFKRDFTIELK